LFIFAGQLKSGKSFAYGFSWLRGPGFRWSAQANSQSTGSLLVFKAMLEPKVVQLAHEFAIYT
jgi:hypothetical protein